MRVYRNVRNKLLSVLTKPDNQRWLLSHHTDRIVIRNAKFTVGKAGQTRVRETGRKNVHAWITGEPTASDDVTLPRVVRTVHYDPYRHDTFIIEPFMGPITRSPWVLIQANGLILAEPV